MERIFSLVLLLALTACSFRGTDPLQTGTEPASVIETTPSPQPGSPTLPPGADITLEQLRNAEYQLGLLDQIRTVQLTDGVFQEGAEADFIAVRMQEILAVGDLDGDGSNEAVVPVAENYGGSGVFVFLAVYTFENNQPIFLTSVAIDDRPIIEALSIENREIYLAATIHAFNDAMCCPTLATMRHYRLTNTGLLMTDFSTKTPTGADRIITISAPADGAEASGVISIQGEISIAPFENNLVYRIYDAGGVEVVAGPIEVSAPDLGAPGTFERSIDLSAFGGTSIRIVVQDVNAADGSLFAMDSIILTVRE
ncbi:MAG: hypothetical protein Kow002_05370 [Anaerolineales bacterium]